MLDFYNTIWVSNSLDPYQAGQMICVQTVSRQQKLPIEGKEINTKQIVDTTFWLKPWLEFISYGHNFFHLAEVLATTNLEQG